MPSLPITQTESFPNASSPTPIGEVLVAATIHRSRGIWPTMRPFPSFALVYMVEGKGRYRDERQPERTIEPGTALLILPGFRHSYGPAPDGGWSEIYLTFQGAIFDLWRETGLLTPEQLVFELQPLGYWFERIHGITRLEGLGQISALQLLLADMLGHQRSRLTSPDETRFIGEAKVRLQTDFGAAIDYPALARQLGVSYETFRKRFSAVTGTSPHQYRLRAIIQEAVRLLHQRPHTNAELADQLGFCNEFYFSRQFKEHTGLTPRQFREHLRAG